MYRAMDLQNELNNWDGKSVQFLENIYSVYAGEASFSKTVVELLDSVAHFQEGASWLLKHHLEQGHQLEPALTRQIYAAVSALKNWVTRLHILQCMPYLKIDASVKSEVENFLRKSIRDKNKFVRAWAYNGFYELAWAFPEYREETLGLLNSALQKEAASVQARVRQILKKGFE